VYGWTRKAYVIRYVSLDETVTEDGAKSKAAVTPPRLVCVMLWKALNAGGADNLECLPTDDVSVAAPPTKSPQEMDKAPAISVVDHLSSMFSNLSSVPIAGEIAAPLEHVEAEAAPSASIASRGIPYANIDQISDEKRPHIAQSKAAAYLRRHSSRYISCARRCSSSRGTISGNHMYRRTDVGVQRECLAPDVWRHQGGRDYTRSRRDYGAPHAEGRRHSAGRPIHATDFRTFAN